MNKYIDVYYNPEHGFKLKDKEYNEEFPVKQDTCLIIEYLEHRDGVLKNLLKSPSYVKKIIIEKSFYNNIQIEAFRSIISLEHLEISDHIENISDRAFKNCINLKEVTLGNNVMAIEKYAFAYCKSLTKVNLSENTQILNTPFIGCSELKEVKYKNINLLNYLQPEKINTLTFATIKEIIEAKYLTQEEKDEILDSFKKAIIDPYEVIESLLYKNIKILENIYLKNVIGADLFLHFSEEAINSKEFYNFIKDKKVQAIERYNLNSFKPIRNPNLILDVFSKAYITSNLDYFEDEIKYNKKFITKVLTDCYNDLGIDDCCKTLNYFKNDENIIGLFASKMYCEMDYEISDFLNWIECDESDYETIYWLAANNINFINILPEDKKEEYIINTCCSFDKINYNINEAKEIICDSISPFNTVKIIVAPNKLHIKITDKQNRSESFEYKEKDKIYPELVRSLKCQIEEYIKENKELDR